MKSILITSNAYFPNVGGIENSLRYLAYVYRDKGYRVDVVVSDVNHVSNEELENYIFQDGVHIHRYSTKHNLPWLFRPFSGFLSLNALFKTLKKIKLEQDPELTISRFHTTTWLAKLAKLQYVVYLLPGVVKFQNHPDHLSSLSGLKQLKRYFQYYYHVWLQQNALSCADQLAIFSENMRRQVNNCILHSNELLLVKPGVDCERFKPVDDKNKILLRQKFNIPLNKTVLLCIGRFVKAKGFIHVFEALKELENTHLLLVGGGEEEQYYRDYIAKCDLGTKVTFAGVQQNPAQCYQLSDLFIMSSKYEPLGQTILEALASGLPVVAFKPSDKVITATYELLSDKEAIYVDELSGVALAKNIQIILSDSCKIEFLKLESRKIAVKRFSWEVLAERIEYNE